jgi:hypothetical protein
MVDRRYDGLKPKDLCGIPWRVALALQADGWYLRSDIIWCLSGGTRVYARTQKGEMPMTIKDMVRLDPATVQLWNGKKWTQVLGWNESPRPDNPIELTLRSGERVGCTPGHQWPTQRGLVRADSLQVGDVIQRTRLPNNAARAPRHLQNDIGWLVGMYLAEGSRGKGGKVIQIASHEDELQRFEVLKIFAEEYGGTCQMHQTTEHGATINIYSPVLGAIIDMYIGGRTAKDKHLKVRCWERSNLFLEALLEGYLEGDGHWDEPNNRWRLGFTRNYNLEADLRTLCARLDIQLRLNPSTTGKFKTFKGEIRFRRSNHHNAKDDGEIVAIGRSRARKFWDIGVEDDPHLFALASGVLTHNSKPNPMPESVTDRPTKAHEYVFLFSKRGRYYFDSDAIREKPTTTQPADWNGYGGKSWHDHSDDLGAGQSQPKQMARVSHPAGRNRRTVWTVATQPYSGAHFATWPEALVEPMVKAGTSERGCCPECGKGWERVVESPKFPKSLRAKPGDAGVKVGYGHPTVNTIGSGQVMQNWRNANPPQTTGWRPTCDHYDEICRANDIERGTNIPVGVFAAEEVQHLVPIPCTVLDPFAGSGTTGVVSRRLGRHFVGLDLSFPYLRDQARARLELDRLDAWQDGIRDDRVYDDLPLFSDAGDALDTAPGDVV